MSEDRFDPTPWWNAEDGEKPVPLGPEGSWTAPDEAELIVNAEREAIIREDTEPNLVTLAQLAATAERPVGSPGVPVSRSTVLVALGILLVGSVAMFILGWQQGKETLASRATAGSVSQPTSDEHLGGSLVSSAQFKNNVKKGDEG